jgi:signal transduction histidine kinase
MYKNSIEQAEYTAIINKEANRLSFLLNDLFEMSKLQVGKFELSLEMANINTIIEKVMMNLSPAAVEKGIVLKRNLANDIPELNIDIQRMEQVLYNLIENALKYTDKGEITVKAYQEKETKIIEISDTGIGIPKLDIPYIWERFYRVDKSRTRNTGGSGLGLFVVKQIVEAHGGKIEVNSIVGMGSTFRIYFNT